MHSPPSSKNILMIDRNFMADRRYILEAKALHTMGCRVLAVCTESENAELNTKEAGDLPLLRFSERAKRTIPDVSLTLEEWINEHKKENSVLDTVEESVPGTVPEETEALQSVFTLSGKMPWWKKYLRKVSNAYSMSQDIRDAAERLSLSPRPVVFRVGGLIAVSLFSMSRALAYLPRVIAGPRRTDIMPMDKSQAPNPPPAADPPPLTSSLHYVNSEDGYFDTYFKEYPLDEWESQVVKFGLAITDLDVVHMHDVTALRPGICIAKKKGIPAIFDAHELYPYQPGIMGKRKAMLFDMEARFIHHCARAIVVNRQHAETLRRDHNYTHCTILSNATERPQGFDLHKRYDYIRARAAIPPDHKIMIFMGGINILRNIDLLLEGMALARKDVHMVFLTWGMEIPFFRALAQKLGIEDRVHFLDPVPTSEILFWCASADVGIIPCQANNFNAKISSPNKFYEFIAAATPIIASSDLLNVKAIMDAENFGVLKLLRVPQDYAEVIEEMFDEKLGGPERFRPSLLQKGDRYLWAQEGRAFMDMYARLLEIEEPQMLQKVGT